MGLVMMLTDEEILDAYASEETTEFLSGSRGIAKAQLKKVVEDAFKRGAIRQVKSRDNFPDHNEVDLIRLQEFLVALLKEIEDGTEAR